MTCTHNPPQAHCHWCAMRGPLKPQQQAMSDLDVMTEAAKNFMSMVADNNRLTERVAELEEAVRREKICTDSTLEVVRELESEVERLQTPEPHTKFIPESAHLEHLASEYASGYHAGWNDCRRQVRKLIEADKDSNDTTGGGDEY